MPAGMATILICALHMWITGPPHTLETEREAVMNSDPLLGYNSGRRLTLNGLNTVSVCRGIQSAFAFRFLFLDLIRRQESRKGDL